MSLGIFFHSNSQLTTHNSPFPEKRISNGKNIGVVAGIVYFTADVAVRDMKIFVAEIDGAFFREHIHYAAPEIAR